MEVKPFRWEHPCSLKRQVNPIDPDFCEGCPLLLDDDGLRCRLGYAYLTEELTFDHKIDEELWRPNVCKSAHPVLGD